MTRFNTFYDQLDLDVLRELCLKYGERREYARGDVWMREGEVCQRIALVVQGYFRYMVRDESGVRAVVTFSFANEFVADFSNSLAGRPSVVEVVAGKKCETLEITADRLLELDEECRMGLELRMMRTLFNTVYMRLIDMYRMSPRERYMQILKAHPDLLQDVPLCDIASYLRISPIHLSRIRKSLSGR